MKLLSSVEMSAVRGGGSGFDDITDLPPVTVSGKSDGDSSWSAIFGWFMDQISAFFNPDGNEQYDSMQPENESQTQILTPQEQELLKMFLQIAEARALGTGTSGTAFAAVQYGNLSAEIASLTIAWAIRDIETYRQIGMHVGNPMGSVIHWGEVAIDWSIYDQGGSPQDVFENFLRANGGR